MIRFTYFILVFFALFLLQSGLSNAEERAQRLTLEQAKRIIIEKGARKAVETSFEDRWDQLLDAIATGVSSWLDIAVELGRHSDAEAAETLDAAMGEALQHSPREVLLRLDGKPFRPENVCGNCFADMGIQGATDFKGSIARQEAAVASVQDAALRDRRDRCLKLIRKNKQP